MQSVRYEGKQKIITVDRERYAALQKDRAIRAEIAADRPFRHDEAVTRAAYLFGVAPHMVSPSQRAAAMRSIVGGNHIAYDHIVYPSSADRGEA